MFRKRAAVIGPSEKFSKALTYYRSSAHWLQSDREKSYLLPIPAAPHAKKGRFLPNWGWFLSLGGGSSWFLGGDIIFFQNSPARTQNNSNSTYISVFENSTYGLRYGDFSFALLR